MPGKRREKRPADTSLAAPSLLEGAGTISAFTGIPEPRVFYLCERGLLPAFKIGAVVRPQIELRGALTSKSAISAPPSSRPRLSSPSLVIGGDDDGLL